MDSIPDEKKPCLIVQIAPGIYQNFRIEKEIIAGREESNALFLNDPGISAQHAAFGIEGQKVWIKDLGSRNGTFVNDVKIEKEYLKNQDSILLGNVKIFFQEKEETNFVKKTKDIFIERENLLSKPRYGVLRFPQRVFSRTPFPLQIFLSSIPIKNFPEELPIAEHIFLQENAHVIKMIPTLPGCIVSPFIQEIHPETMPLKTELWITPLNEEGNINGSLQFLEQGKILKMAKISFSVLSLFWHRLFFSLALLFPIFGILLELSLLPMHRKLPYMLYAIVSMIRALGGPTQAGLFLGIIFLGIAFFRLLCRKKQGTQWTYQEISF